MIFIAYNGRVMMYCKNGENIDLQYSEDMIYTLSNIAREDWEVVRMKFDFKDLMAFGMFILALLTFIFYNGK